jgi:hypothetical protein
MEMTKDVERPGGGKVDAIVGLESEPSAPVEAESMLQSLVWSLRDPHFSVEQLPSLMKTYLLALRLLGADDKWVSAELKGYSRMGEVPGYRYHNCKVTYTTEESGAVIGEEHSEMCGFDQSVGFMVDHRTTGWEFTRKGGDKDFVGRVVATKRRATAEQWYIDNALEKIAEELFDRATKTLVTARFGAVIDTIFRDYQRAVGNALSNLGIEDHLETAYRNMKGGDESKWRAGALVCRNVLHDLATKLWCVQGRDYNFGDGRGLVKLNNPPIRLRAYMREKGLDKQDIPVALLGPVYSEGSAAKIRCSYEDARSVLIMTYLFVAELIRKTDMEPVTEIKKGGSKGKK